MRKIVLASNNEKKVKELKNIYEDYIHKMLDDLCDEKC